MSTKTINIVIIAGVVTFLAALAMFVRVGATADSVAVLKTGNMTCSSCSQKITAALQNTKGVAVTEVDVNGGWVIIAYDTKTVKPEALASVVSNAGFASSVNQILTPEQFKQITGREIGAKMASTSGCCSGKGGGCSAGKQI